VAKSIFFDPEKIQLCSNKRFERGSHPLNLKTGLHKYLIHPEEGFDRRLSTFPGLYRSIIFSKLIHKMSSTAWIQELKVAELKDELKKRGQPVAGKKAELAARLEEYVKEHEARSAENPAAAAGGEAEEGGEQAAPVDVEVTEEETKVEEPAAEEAKFAEPEPKTAEAERAGAEEVAAPVQAPPHDDVDVDLDYGDSDDEQPQKQEAKPVEKAAAAPLEKDEEKQEKQETQRNAEPESRKRPTSDDLPPSEKAAAHLEKRVKTEAPSRQEQPSAATATATTAAEKAEPAEKQQDRKPGSRALLIEGFVRPFTENQARILLSQSGTVVAMWMPSIRNLAWVVYSTKSEAEAAKTTLFKLQWPAGSPKVLMPRSVSIRAAEKAIGQGNSNPDFKVERTEEDGPDEPEIEGNTMDVVGTIKISATAGQPSTSRRQHEDDDETLKDASPLRVKDLRELLSRKSTGGGATAERKRRDPGPNLDELFRKTTAKPAIYWLPLSEEAVELKKKAKAALATAGGGGGQGGGSGGRGSGGDQTRRQ
jgi:apoptotic chromatin condensation inducer in the nucleus